MWHIGLDEFEGQFLELFIITKGCEVFVDGKKHDEVFPVYGYWHSRFYKFKESVAIRVRPHADTFVVAEPFPNTINTTNRPVRRVPMWVSDDIGGLQMRWDQTPGSIGWTGLEPIIAREIGYPRHGPSPANFFVPAGTNVGSAALPYWWDDGSHDIWWACDWDWLRIHYCWFHEDWASSDQPHNFYMLLSLNNLNPPGGHIEFDLFPTGVEGRHIIIKNEIRTLCAESFEKAGTIPVPGNIIEDANLQLRGYWKSLSPQPLVRDLSLAIDGFAVNAYTYEAS
jgi:hypothetical protein